MASSTAGPVRSELPDSGPRPGDILDGKYRIERIAGSGGMGIVAEATHLLLEQRLAIKFPRRDLAGQEAAARRFLREGKAAFSVRSEHVVRVFDFGLTATREPYITMEYLEGRTVRALLQDMKKLPFEEAALVAMQAMKGVEAAHAAGLVHRDLKPSNLFVVPAPEGDVVKVLDFGIAKASLEQPSSPAVTGSDAAFGSPGYMSPEQIRGLPVDARSDVWSLGVIFYELVSGAVPFDGESSRNVVAKILMDPPAGIRRACPDLPPVLESIIFECLSKDPDERPRTVADLRRRVAAIVPERALRLVRGPPVSEGAAGTARTQTATDSCSARASAQWTLGKTRARHVVLAAVSTAVLGAAAAGIPVQRSPTPRPAVESSAPAAEWRPTSITSDARPLTAVEPRTSAEAPERRPSSHSDVSLPRRDAADNAKKPPRSSAPRRERTSIEQAIDTRL